MAWPASTHHGWPKKTHHGWPKGKKHSAHWYEMQRKHHHGWPASTHHGWPHHGMAHHVSMKREALLHHPRRIQTAGAAIRRHIHFRHLLRERTAMHMRTVPMSSHVKRIHTIRLVKGARGYRIRTHRVR